MQKVLIMMSTYNGGCYLREQIDSILAQKNCALDLLVRDDGSTDQTISILNEYKIKKKLDWYSGGNLGPAKSFMNLISNAPASYDFYGFADQDDVWKNDKIEQAINHISYEDYPIIYCCNAELVDSKLKSLNEKSYQFKPTFSFPGILFGGGLQGAGMIFNKSLFNIISSNKSPNYISMHDYYIGCICLSLGGSVIYDTNPYIYYRQHDNNVLGVKKSFKNTIKNRVKMIFNKDHFFDIVQTSKALLNDYQYSITPNNKKLLTSVLKYKNNIFNRIMLATTPGIGNGRRNISIAIRISIVLGKL